MVPGAGRVVEAERHVGDEGEEALDDRLPVRPGRAHGDEVAREVGRDEGLGGERMSLEGGGPDRKRGRHEPRHGEVGHGGRPPVLQRGDPSPPPDGRHARLDDLSEEGEGLRGEPAHRQPHGAPSVTGGRPSSAPAAQPAG